MRTNKETPIPVLENIVLKLGWKLLPGFGRNYYANADGEIYSVSKTTGKLKQLKPHINKRFGYCTVDLKCEDGKYRRKRVSRLIALVFVKNDDPEHKRFVHHVNHDRGDNSAKNLAWTDHRENCRRRKDNEHKFYLTDAKGKELSLQ